jgi:hypothetical protein
MFAWLSLKIVDQVPLGILGLRPPSTFSEDCDLNP